jgi:hypothetical protein
MKFSVTGQGKGDLLIQVTVDRGGCMGGFDCIYMALLFSSDDFYRSL